MAKRLTDKEAYELYLRIWPDEPWTTDSWENSRQKAIADEVRKMLSAPTLDDAFRVCEWWAIDDEDAKRLRRDVARLRKIGR